MHHHPQSRDELQFSFPAEQELMPDHAGDNLRGKFPRLHQARDIHHPIHIQNRQVLGGGVDGNYDLLHV